jgi:hypothetical protein
MFLEEKELLFVEGMIFPGKKRLKLFPGHDCPWGNICFELFSNHNHLIISFIYVCNLSLERSRREIQLGICKHFNENSHAKILCEHNFCM